MTKLQIAPSNFDQTSSLLLGFSSMEYSFHLVAKNSLLAAHSLVVDAQSITDTTL